MSRIDDLISQHCPNGVEFGELQEIFHIRNGYTPSKSNKNFWKSGTVPFFQVEDILKNGTILYKSMQNVSEMAIGGGIKFPTDSIIIATTAFIGNHALIKLHHLF